MDEVFIIVWKVITIIVFVLGMFLSLATPWVILVALFWGWICNHTAKHKKNTDVDFAFLYGSTWGIISWLYYLSKADK